MRRVELRYSNGEEISQYLVFTGMLFISVFFEAYIAYGQALGSSKSYDEEVLNNKALVSPDFVFFRIEVTIELH